MGLNPNQVNKNLATLTECSRTARKILKTLMRHYKQEGNQGAVEAVEDALWHMRRFDRCIEDIY